MCPYVGRICASSGAPESITQTASRSAQPFLHSSRQIVVGMPGHVFPLKIAPSQTAFRSVQQCLHSSRQSVVGHVGACPSPSKLPLPVGDLDPHPIHGFVSPPCAHDRNGISIGSAIFAQLTAECPYWRTLQWAALSPQNCPFSWGTGSHISHLIHGFLPPSESSTQTASRSVQPFLQDSLV